MFAERGPDFEALLSEFDNDKLDYSDVEDESSADELGSGKESAPMLPARSRNTRRLRGSLFRTGAPST